MSKFTAGPWRYVERKNQTGITAAFVDFGNGHIDLSKRPHDARLIAAAPRMVAVLQRAARILAELPDSEQTPQMLALRAEIVETIKQATPEYYGLPAHGQEKQAVKYFYQDGAQFYDAETHQRLMSLSSMVKGADDIEGAARARKYFMGQRPEYRPESEKTEDGNK